MGNRWLLAGLLCALAAGCNCGDVNQDDDAGVEEQDAGEADAGGDDAGGGGEGDAGFDGGGCLLKPNGTACAASSECCSDRCDVNTGTCISGAGVCQALGELCQANVECCGGRTCAADATGTRRCTDESFCQSQGESCAQASQCCSLSCGNCQSASDGGQDCSCQTSGTFCVQAGEGCTSDVNCCSNICNNGTCQAAGAGCSTFGESCTTAGFDATCCSKYCVEFGTDGGSDLRCAPSSSCAARGEICAAANDCCSGVCLNGLCPAQNMVGQKLFVGEPCVQDSNCASYACASAFPGGPKTCQFLGGCRPAEEICTADYQCCGYQELSASNNMCKTPTPTAGACKATGLPGLSRCVLMSTDKEVGEICESAGVKVHNCCGGDEVCQPTVTGVSRCLGGAFSPDAGCTANGAGCSVADQCCSGVCAPGTLGDGGTGLLCSGCVANGGLCTTGNDCCNKSCVNGVCEAPINDAGPVCLPLAATCASDSDCCSSICSGGACSTCRVTDDVCSVGGDCCSGQCNANPDGGASTCAGIG